MALGNTNVSLDALLKELYSSERVVNTLFKKNVLLGMLPKSEDVTGRHYNWPIVVASGAARSASYSEVSTAEALSGEVTKVFQIALTENFANANVSSRAIAETSNDKGAFLRAVSLIADNQLTNFGNDVAIAAYRTSDGNRGQVAVGGIGTPSGGVANSQVTMKVTKDILNIEVGMTLDAFTAKSGGSQRAHGANGHGLYVKAVDYVAGTFIAGNLPTPGATSVDATGADGLTGLTGNDYLFVAGDRALKMHGFQDWIPYGGPLVGDSFFGVDRTTSPTRLAGLSLDGTSGASLASVLEDGISNVGEQGGELSHYMMNHKQFNNLAKELGSKAQLVTVSLNAQIGYEGIKIVGATGAVICLPDRPCPPNTVCGMNMETWELLSIGKAVHVWDMDGKVWLRTPSDSGMQIRFHSLVEMLCKDPRQNINIRVNP